MKTLPIALYQKIYYPRIIYNRQHAFQNWFVTLGHNNSLSKLKESIILCKGEPVNETHIRDSFKWNSIKKFGRRKSASTALKFTGSILGTVGWGERLNTIFIPWSVRAFVTISATCLVGGEKEARQLEKSNMINTGTVLRGRCHYLLPQNVAFVSLCAAKTQCVCSALLCSSDFVISHPRSLGQFDLFDSNTSDTAQLWRPLKFNNCWFSWEQGECSSSGGKSSPRRAGSQSSPTEPDP